MSFESLFSAANISASGLSAERLRLEVVANNIANAHATRTSNGEPYRRRDVVFAAVLDDQLAGFSTTSSGLERLGGVRVEEIIEDPASFPRIYQPGHPEADAEGFVLMPNVQLPLEMVNLITASRAYEANLKVLQAFRQQAEQALILVRT